MLPGDRCLPGALVCCLFGWWAAVPAWCLLCIACLVAGSLLGLFSGRICCHFNLLSVAPAWYPLAMLSTAKWCALGRRELPSALEKGEVANMGGLGPEAPAIHGRQRLSKMDKDGPVPGLHLP